MNTVEQSVRMSELRAMPREQAYRYAVIMESERDAARKEADALMGQNVHLSERFGVVARNLDAAREEQANGTKREAAYVAHIATLMAEHEAARASTAAVFEKGLDVAGRVAAMRAERDHVAAALRQLIAQHDCPHGFSDEQWYGEALAIARNALGKVQS